MSKGNVTPDYVRSKAPGPQPPMSFFVPSDVISPSATASTSFRGHSSFCHDDPLHQDFSERCAYDPTRPGVRHASAFNVSLLPPHEVTAKKATKCMVWRRRVTGYAVEMAGHRSVSRAYLPDEVLPSRAPQ